MEERKTQFLFKDNEFEDNNFHAAAFVAKYRRVTSLESLRDQLRLYCQSLKDELYGIINRDYKDFITIATKLEGVDIRVEQIRKPLVELRKDLTIVNDTMVSNIHVIREKLIQKEEITYRKKLLESSIACMEKIKDVELVLSQFSYSKSSSLSPLSSPSISINQLSTTNLNNSNVNNNNINNSNNNANSNIGSSSSGLKSKEKAGLCRRDLIRLSIDSNLISNTSTLSRQLLECSEFERAAISLSMAKKMLQQQEQQQQQQNKNSEENINNFGVSISSSSIASAIAMRRSLDARIQSLLVMIETQLKERLTSILSPLISFEREKIIPISLSSDVKRSIGHLLRGISFVEKGYLAEQLIAELFTIPLIKTYLTQGQIDGSEGRGSYSGLNNILTTIFNHLKYSLQDTLLVSEEIFSINSLSLSTTVSTSTSTTETQIIPPIDLIIGGIWKPLSSILQEQYSGMFQTGITTIFHRTYTSIELFLKNLSQICGLKYSKIIFERIQKNESVQSFQQLWKFDLYFQLRSQEILSRLDLSFQLIDTNGITGKIFDNIYSESSYNSTTLFDQQQQQQQSIIQSIGKSQIQYYLNNPPVKISTTTLTNISNVKLQFTQIILLELLTVFNENIFISSIGTKFIILSIKLLNQYEKFILSIIENKFTSFIEINDLMSLMEDILYVALWIQQLFIPFIEDKLINVNNLEENYKIVNLIQKCFNYQSDNLYKLFPVIWSKLSFIVVSECKNNLKNVKSVAGKFRMTNKPPPDTPSEFVSVILKPLKSFIDQYSEVIYRLFRPKEFNFDNWIRSIIENVTQNYSQQIQSLMETAQQMDNALQRRSKLRSTGVSSGNNNTQMTDSEKIALQMLLDVQSFGERIQEICVISPHEINGYVNLMNEVIESKRLIESK